MNSLFAASTHGRRICLLEFAIVLTLKKNLKNSSREMQRLQMNPPRECGLIRLINSYLAFSSFIFLRQRYCNQAYISGLFNYPYKIKVV